MELSISSSRCKLCGLPTQSANITLDGHSFCCRGCREVYRCFGDIRTVDDSNNPPPSNRQKTNRDAHVAYLRIDGMHCASCEYLIENIGEKMPGILSVSCSFSSAMAKIEFDPELIDESELPSIFNKYGYHALLNTDRSTSSDDRMTLLRLITAETLVTTVMMLYLAFYYPTHIGLVSLEDMQPIAWMTYNVIPKVLFVLATIMIGYVGFPIFRGAWIGLRTGILNMDNLLALAILAAYGYSTWQMLLGSIDLYFDVAVVIVTVVTIGRYLENQEKEKATQELSQIMTEWSPAIRVINDDETQIIQLDELQPHDQIEVWAGEIIPVDGIIQQGQGAIDESLMTGEPCPASKGSGEKVLGGTTLVEGKISIDVGNQIESQIENLAHILWNAQIKHGKSRKLTDAIARAFVPIVLIMALLVTAGMLISGSSLSTALLAGMATLIVSCPCTFGLAIPLTTAIGISTALRKGIIITRTDIFEKIKPVKTIVLDKTGTLTTAEMTVTSVIGPPLVKELAVAVERRSSHPIAQAIARMDSPYQASEINIYPGKGAKAVVDDHVVAVGSRSFLTLLGWFQPVPVEKNTGDIVSYVAWDGKTHGAILTHDTPRPGWKQVTDKMRENSRVVLLTGAENIGLDENDFDDCFAEVPPEGKAAVIQQLKKEGGVLMIGDGSNDAAALASADIGIAFGAPAMLAADAAAIVIPGNQLEKVFSALEIIQTTHKRIRQNLGWALLYNAIAIPLAIFGVLNPLFAALAMSGSSLLVVWNSTRSIPMSE